MALVTRARTGSGLRRLEFKLAHVLAGSPFPGLHMGITRVPTSRGCVGSSEAKGRSGGTTQSLSACTPLFPALQPGGTAVPCRLAGRYWERQ